MANQKEQEKSKFFARALQKALAEQGVDVDEEVVRKSMESVAQHSDCQSCTAGAKWE